MAITLYLFIKIYPSAIPGYSFPISTLIASLKKIGYKMLQAESENNALTDGRTDRRIDRHTDRQKDGRTLERNFWNGGYNIIPRTF